MKASEVLDRAADLCETGWTQGRHVRLVGDTFRYCAAGALRVADGSSVCVGYLLSHGGWVALEVAMYALEEHLHVESIVAWNDAPERTQDEVVRTLRQVAALEREAGR